MLTFDLTGPLGIAAMGLFALGALALAWRRPPLFVGLMVAAAATGLSILLITHRPGRPTAPDEPDLGSPAEYEATNKQKIELWRERHKAYEEQSARYYSFATPPEVVWEGRLGVVLLITGLAMGATRIVVWGESER